MSVEVIKAVNCVTSSAIGRISWPTLEYKNGDPAAETPPTSLDKQRTFIEEER
jgi:hypothetical protein